MLGSSVSIFICAVFCEPAAAPVLLNPSLAVTVIEVIPSLEIVRVAVAEVVPILVKPVVNSTPLTKIAATFEESVAVIETVTGFVTNQPFEPSGVGTVTVTVGGIASD